MGGIDVLIVEDEAVQREMLGDFLIREGHHVMAAENGRRALELVAKHSLDLVLLDLRMPGMDGLELIQELKRLNPELDAVIITAFGTIETAVAAMKAGARDFITKPIDFDQLTMLIERITEHRRLIQENRLLKEQLQADGVATDTLRYRSPQMAELINLAGRVAVSEATVLIQGETGTGKELLARLIHSLSPRADRPLVPINCAAIPETLIEAELFGHEKGAFTGALQRRIGLCEQADGGTVFLDEIGELSPAVQVKLLRFLQERRFQRVGGDRMLKADVRILCATHRDLEAKIREGTFREDFYYRINVVSLKIPPLRERREDIPLLIDHFIQRFARANGKAVEGTTREARDILIRYDYPGNVRELENIMERAVVISRGPYITVAELPFAAGPEADRNQAAVVTEPKGSLQHAVAELERQMIQEALIASESNQSRAAERLGLSERMLRYKLKKYGFK